MKSLRMREDRSLFFLDVPQPPTPGPEEVLIKMKYASICGFDMMTLAGNAAFPQEGMIGHEGSGVVVATGSHVAPSRLAVGDHVTINPYTACGLCVACQSNHPEFCINPIANPALMTEYVLYDQRQIYRLPKAMSLQAGSLVEPLMMAMHAVEKARPEYGQTLLILGGGAMGQLILKVARTMPYGTIVVADPHPEKRAAALRFGADIALDPNACNIVSESPRLTAGLGFNAVIEASGSQSSAQSALRMVARGGTVVYFGLYGMDFDLNVNLMNLYWTDGYITAVCVPSGKFPAAIALAQHIAPEEVITGVFPFEEAIEAFRVKAGGDHAKIMLSFD